MVHPRHRAEGVLPDPRRVPAGHLARSAKAAGGALTGLRLAAGLVWPVSGSPIADGAILIDAAGRIVAVGPAGAVPAPPGVPAEQLADVAILPGLVNAHTHLELTAFRGMVTDPGFADWILHVRRLKEETDAAAFTASAREGVREAWRHGTTTVADTGDTGAAVRALGALGGRGVVYQEVFGPHPAQAGEALAALEQAVARLAAEATGGVAIGVSPHAPYTVSADLYRSVARFARMRGLPIAAHVAESPAETALIVAGEGPFAERWGARGIPAPAPARSPIAYVDRAGLLGPDLLAIHAVQAGPDDVGLLARHGAAVAICPRSNAAHGHGSAPLGSYLAAGIRVGLGTDSVASVPDLDLLAEARAARRLADLSAVRAIALLTLEGAGAIGMDREIGSLEPGKWADLSLVRVGAATGASAEEAAGAILEGSVARTYVAGREVWREEAGEGGRRRA